MEWKDKKRIGVIGGSQANEKYLEFAFQVGQLIAKKGAILICGGLSGVMEAASRGAKEAGGMTVGILPGRSPDEANPHIDIAIATGMGHSRNSLVAMNADALIAIDGRYGTLTEIGFASIYGKRIIGLGTWDIKGVIQAATPEEAIEFAFR